MPQCRHQGCPRSPGPHADASNIVQIERGLQHLERARQLRPARRRPGDAAASGPGQEPWHLPTAGWRMPNAGWHSRVPTDAAAALFIGGVRAKW